MSPRDGPCMTRSGHVKVVVVTRPAARCHPFPSLTLFDGIGIEKHNNKNPKK